jgi:Tfp pilus assembly protein PilN
MRAVNLLPPELRAAQKGALKPSALETSGGIGAFALLGALTLCVVAVAGSALANNVIKERKASLAEVTAENQATVQRAAELKPYADFQTLANDRVSTVHALAGARFDWEQSLRDLSRAIPSDVYLNSLTGDVGGTSTVAASGLRSALTAPAITMTGCTRSQPAVAVLLSRLRNIQGVTRVSLSKSKKPDPEPNASLEEVGPCGKGTPPTFELVVFFEKATVGAALADVTKATTVGATAAPAATPDAGTGKAAATATPAATQEGATP